MTRPKRSRERIKVTPLRTWLDATGPSITPEELAERFDCTRSTVYGLLDGTRTPSLELAIRIEENTNGAVTPAMWIRSRKRRAA